MFVLLARDAGAPARVREWCDQREREIAEGKRPAVDIAQVVEARKCADDMEAWRTANDGAWRTGLFAGAIDGGDAPVTMPHQCTRSE